MDKITEKGSSSFIVNKQNIIIEKRRGKKKRVEEITRVFAGRDNSIFVPR